MTYDELKKAAEQYAHSFNLRGDSFAAAVLAYMTGYLQGSKETLEETREWSNPKKSGAV